MQKLTLDCPACGAAYRGAVTSRFLTCEYCGTRFALSKDELDALGFRDTDGDGYDDDDQHSAPNKTTIVYQDDSNEPMRDFAKEACADFLRSIGSDDQEEFEKTNKIVNGLGVESEVIYLIHDDTLFGSGKNGFAITDRGFFCREWGDRKAHFVPWGELARYKEPWQDDSYTRAGTGEDDGFSLTYYSGNDDNAKSIFELVKKLWFHACKVC